MEFRCAKQPLLLALLLAGTAAGIAGAADPVDELKVCAKIQDRDARLACYDRLGQRVLADERVAEVPPPPVADETEVPPQVAAQADVPPPPEPPPPAAEAAAPAPATVASETTATASDAPSLPDNLGGTFYEKQSKAGRTAYRGQVTSCRKGPDKRWYFYFASGQVWRESNTSQRRFSDCRFIVTITRDGLGYKMQIDGKKSKIRVARRQ